MDEERTNKALGLFVILTLIFGCLLVAIICYLTGVFVPSNVVEGLVVVQKTEQPVVVSTELAPVETEKVTSWAGDDLGIESPLPGKIEGPAIAELWDPTNFCGLVKINSGESLDWSGSGAYWVAASPEALAARWSHHLVEYSAKPGNRDCGVFFSAKSVTQNP